MPCGLAAAEHARSAIDSVLNQVLNALRRTVAHHRSDLGVRRGGIADFERPGFRDELVDERLDHRLLHDEPLGRHADLTLMHEGPEVGGRSRLVEIGIVEHDERRLAPELEQHRLEVLRRLLGDRSGRRWWSR